MYISVLPLSRSLHPRPYIYSVSSIWEDQIIIGWLVEVPIGNHVERGVVGRIVDVIPEEVEIRPIVSVISSIPLLSSTEIAMTEHLALRYFLPIHKVLAFFLPAPLLSRLDKKNYILSVREEIWGWASGNIHEIHHYIDRICTPKDLSDMLEPWTVVILPDDFFLFSFESCFPEKTLIVPQESTPTKKSQAWIDAYEWKYEIFVWTRKILYYNLRAFSHIIYLEESFGTEQYQYPYRINNLDILRTLADTSAKHITIISSSPSLSLFANFRDFKIIPRRSPS